jgi:hypothetical protein
LGFGGPGEAAKKHRAKIEEHASTEDKQHHEAIGDHYSKATEHRQALKKEPQKLTRDCSEIKPDAAGVDHETKKAEEEHQAIKAKSKITELKEPDYVW